MRLFGRLLAVVLTAAIGLAIPGLAHAQLGPGGTNVQDGNNSATSNQGGSDASGDAVGGQVSSVVTEGNTSVDARNTTSDSTVESGESFGENAVRSFTGLKSEEVGGDPVARNFQDGNNRTAINQAADATSGDAISGQVVGAVTGPAGSARIVARNVSDDNNVETGIASFLNDSESFVGLNATPTTDPGKSTAIARNTQDGNNTLSLGQTASSATGDGIAGQVIGALSNGVTSIDADNRSTGNDVDTVDTASDNTSFAWIGLDANADSNGGTATAINTQDGNNTARISQFAPGTANAVSATVGLNAEPTSNNGADATATNEQDGNNAFLLDQTAPVSTASVDSVAGQVIGSVTDEGGSASLVAANVSDSNSVRNIGVAGQILGVVSAGATSVDARNSSMNNDVDGGVTSGSNDATAFVGLEAEATTGNGGLGGATATNLQDGNNRASGSQSSSVTGGIPVAGQVIGDVTSAGGSSSIVAANVSADNNVETGDADAPNTLEFAFVGLEAESYAGVLPGGASASNFQDGNNSFRLSDLSSATSGDAIAGQILGVVSDGRTSLDARNTSKDNSVKSGDAVAANDSVAFVGLDATARDSNGGNVQTGDNRASASHSAEATTGDAIAGQIGGVVTGAGGSVSVVLENTSTAVDAETGDAFYLPFEDVFVGLFFEAGPVATG